MKFKTDTHARPEPAVVNVTSCMVFTVQPMFRGCIVRSLVHGMGGSVVNTSLLLDESSGH